MAVARLQVHGPRPASSGESVDDAVELYQRTYSTLLRSSGETRLRVLEPSHRAMGSSLHPLADSDELDLGAFIYAIRRLPAGIVRARRIVMGQEPEAFARAGVGPLEEWEPVEAPARRRRWYDGGGDTVAVLLASESDVDDLVPTLVAFQIEWNKINQRMRAAGWPDGADHDPEPEEYAATLGGAVDDWLRLRDAWGEAFAPHMREIATRRESLRVRMLGGTQVGYARITRRWWAPVRDRLVAQQLEDRPIYFVSSNTHSLSNLVTGIGRAREDELLAYLEGLPESDGLRGELHALRDGRSEGSWDNFLYFVAREWIDAGGAQLREWRRKAEADAGVEHLPSRTAMRVPAQIIALDRLDAARLDPRLGAVDPQRLAASPAVIVNVDYPLGLAAYNILREVAVDASALRAVYVLGKAATLNADVGDVMISSVVHDEHSGTTYWLDNAFGVEDIEPDLRFGTGLDNQRAVTVKSTFLQNRSYLDFYYREAFTVVEMEAGPYCNAVYEIADADRYPVGEAVNFSKLPVDFGVIHYASDTPYTQARTLGARGLSYYGMDSTYAASLAILRRVLRLEGTLR
ncbi:MAG: hypothetical protein QOH72_874 [Solirubrobacteraceae bacterium]|nr:hypothetical protein [Solirubrobacteraceae bacterium]